MNVGQLRQMLESYEDSITVSVAYNCGDYWKSIVAPEAEVVELLPVEYSNYHNKYQLGNSESSDKNAVQRVIIAATLVS